ncbi:MAG: hypothetical protein ABIP58_03520 [Dehalococcoidia bacterium]
MDTNRSSAGTRARPVIIASVRRLSDRQDVWCLTVPDGHLWPLANGALAHNSHPADMLRYAAVGEDLMSNDRARPRPPAANTGPRAGDAGLGWMGS